MGLLTGIRQPAHMAASLHRPGDYDDHEVEAEEWSLLSGNIKNLLRQHDAELLEVLLTLQR